MPPGSVIRYDQPCPGIADFITGYHLYAAHGPDSVGKVDWFLPGTANVRLLFDAGPISVRIRRREFTPLPAAALFGPTSHALRAETNGGLMIGFGISALGWARLFGVPAAPHCNVISALADVTGPELPRRLMDALAGVSDEHAVAPALDALLEPLLGRPSPDEPAIRALMAVLVDPSVVDVASAADRVGIDPTALRRLSTRYFGMPTKLLLRRARFLRSFTAIFRVPDAVGYRGIDRSYHDVSHFLRDADHFLGMTPRRFMAMSTPFLDASVRARAAVLGAPTQALHDIARRARP